MTKKSKRRQGTKNKVTRDSRWHASLPQPQPGQSTGWKSFADMRRDDFIGCPKDATLPRVYCLITWHNFFKRASVEHNSMGPKYLTKTDKRFVDGLVENEDELCFVRILTTLGLALYHQSYVEFEYSLHCYIETLKMCVAFPTSEKTIDLGFMKDLSHEFGRDRIQLLGDFVPGIELVCREVVNKNAAAIDPGPRMAFHQNEERLGIDLLYKSGGFHCDLCRKPTDNVLERMGSCSRCKLTFYCSTNCLKNDWERHKKQCRKRGEYKVGDLVYSIKTEGIFRFGSILEILKPGQAAGSWTVGNCGLSLPLEEDLFPDQLKRCRPYVWPYVWKKVEAIRDDL